MNTEIKIQTFSEFMWETFKMEVPDILTYGTEALGNTLSFRSFMTENFPVTINRKHYEQLLHQCVHFEIRDHNPECLNSPLLGIKKMVFTEKDSQALYDIFNIDPVRFKKLLHSFPDVDITHRVISDPYNVLTVWLAHLVTKSELSREQKDIMMMTLFKLLHYKFFTSIINHDYPYGADEGVMSKVIDSLSGKYDIKSPATPTWRLVMEARSNDVFAAESPHYRTINQFIDYKLVAYVISDIQTRLRVKINNINEKYYQMKADNNRIGSDSLVSSIDGEKNIKAIVASFDTMISGITNDVLNVNRFIDYESIDIVCKLTVNIKPDMLKGLLIKFSEVAVQQFRKGDKEKTTGKDSFEKLIGYHVLISNIIQKTYRACILDSEVNTSNHGQLLRKAENIYKSSRISDKDILVIKNSVESFCEEHGNSKRPSTIASLKIGFILYIMLLSFKRQ